MPYGSRIHLKVFAVTILALAVLWGGVVVWAERERDEAVAGKLDILSQIAAGVTEHSRGLFKLAELDAYFERKREAQQGSKCPNEGGQP